MCPSCVSARPAAVFFFVSVLALLAAPARPACALCSSSCYPGPAALRPLSRLSPLPFSFSLSTLPARLPSLTVQRCHSRVPLACPTPAPPPRPYPFLWVLPWSPPLTPSWLPGALCGGGGGVPVVWTVALYPPCAPSQQGVEVRNARHCAAVAPVVEVPAAVRSRLVVPALARTPVVLDSLHLSSRHRAIFVDYGTCSLLYLQSDTGNAVPPPHCGV